MHHLTGNTPNKVRANGTVNGNQKTQNFHSETANQFYNVFTNANEVASTGSIFDELKEQMIVCGVLGKS